MTNEVLGQPVVYIVGNCASFSVSVECRTVSKALLKSRQRTMTNLIVVSVLVMVFSSCINAAVVDPVGLKASESVGGALLKERY